jgi:PAS domain S-box-containing protein
MTPSEPSLPLNLDKTDQSDRPSWRSRQLSLKILLIVPFVTQVIAAVGITGWLSIQNGREATQELAPQIGQEVAHTIESHVRKYMNLPLRILTAHGASAKAGMLNFDRLEDWRQLFWQQMQQEKGLYFFYAANPKGQFVGVERQPSALFLHLLLDQSSSMPREIYQLDLQGQPTDAPRLDNYDPRDRPWYQEAIQKQQIVWSQIYQFKARSLLGITASLPIYNAAGQLQGVMAIDIPLTQIGSFLRNLKIAKTGQAFILGVSGNLIATSTNEEISNSNQVRIHATQSQNPLLKAIFGELQQRNLKIQDLPPQQQIVFDWEGIPQYVQLSKIKTEEGLEWLLIVSISELDFRDRININTRNTIILCLLAMILASITGLYTSKWIAQPVERLIAASHLLSSLSASADRATGKPYQPIETANVRELSILADSFNQMAQKLQISFTALAESKEDLEIRVAQRTAELAEFLSLQQATFEAIADGVIAVDQTGQINSYNQRFVNMFELSPKFVTDSQQSGCLEFLAVKMRDPQTFIERSRELCGHLESESYDILELVDGRILERFSRPQWLNSQIIGRVWSFQDITARVQAERQLEEQKTYLRLIIDSIPQQIFWKDTQLVFRGCNKNWAMYAQLDSPESVVGKTDYDLVGDRHLAETFRNHDRRIMESNTPELHIIQRKLNPDQSGQSIWLDASKLPIIDAEGKTIGILGVLDDITERKLAEEALHAEQEKSERLLLNILPKAIADRLKQFHGVIADSYASVTVLFADIVGFTNMSSEMTPQALVDLLNLIFSQFDTLSEKYGLEKIKTIGDAYMVAGGIPQPTDNHAAAIAMMALEMQTIMADLRNQTGKQLQIRIGIHTGAVIAGVIGMQKFIYDLWGDTVNIASRMESHSQVGKIQVTDTTYELLKHKFILEERGEIEVKGKGLMTTYWLINKID